VAQFLTRIVFASGAVREELATEEQILRLFEMDAGPAPLVSHVIGSDLDGGACSMWHHSGTNPPFSARELATGTYPPKRELR
jgi:hypothetical protein